MEYLDAVCKYYESDVNFLKWYILNTMERHILGALGSLKKTVLLIYCWSAEWIFGEDITEYNVSLLDSQCTCNCLQIYVQIMMIFQHFCIISLQFVVYQM